MTMRSHSHFIRIAIALTMAAVTGVGLLIRDRLGEVIAQSDNPAAEGAQGVRIREFKKRAFLLIDQVDSTFRFEEWNDKRIVSCVSQFIGSYPVETAEVRWNTDGSCSCFINKDEWAVFGPDGWEKRELGGEQ